MTQNGYKSTVKTLSNKLARKTIQFEEVRKILDILGYDIEYRERTGYVSERYIVLYSY